MPPYTGKTARVIFVNVDLEVGSRESASCGQIASVLVDGAYPPECARRAANVANLPAGTYIATVLQGGDEVCAYKVTRTVPDPTLITEVQ